MTIDHAALMTAALQARQNAYAPYSGFAVGAAIQSEDGRIFTGCNVENASYSLTLCAERTALTAAVSQGATRFTAMAIVGAKRDDIPEKPCYPCGACLQVLTEFCERDMPVILTGGVVTVGELMPNTFTLEG